MRSAANLQSACMSDTTARAFGLDLTGRGSAYDIAVHVMGDTS